MTTILLIHGLWVTPRSWEHWVPYYEALGHTVVTPAYPGFEVGVQALRADPSPIATVTVTDTLTHLEKIIADLPEDPIIVGHCFGGTLTQLLLDRGYGAAGVVIGSMPPAGIQVRPPSLIRSLMPILNNPANRHRAAGFTREQWRYAITNTLSEKDSRDAYGRYAIPAPGSWFWTDRMIASLTPGHQDTWVDFHNPYRAPLLVIAGGKDHVAPPAVNRSNARHYAGAGTVTEYCEFPERGHWTCAEPAWETLADTALTWALRHAG